jgi:hypothetical protein
VAFGYATARQNIAPHRFAKLKSDIKSPKALLKIKQDKYN